MQIVNTDEVETENKIGNPLFVGSVTSKQLLNADTDEGIRVGLVMFNPGGRNVWHTHSHEQILYITDGKGIVATEKEEVIAVPGMIIRIPPGEKHWHGATNDTSFSHLAIVKPGKNPKTTIKI